MFVNMLRCTRNLLGTITTPIRQDLARVYPRLTIYSDSSRAWVSIQNTSKRAISISKQLRISFTGCEIRQAQICDGFMAGMKLHSQPQLQNMIFLARNRFTTKLPGTRQLHRTSLGYILQAQAPQLPRR